MNITIVSVKTKLAPQVSPLTPPIFFPRILGTIKEDNKDVVKRIKCLKILIVNVVDK